MEEICYQIPRDLPYYATQMEASFAHFHSNPGWNDPIIRLFGNHFPIRKAVLQQLATRKRLPSEITRLISTHNLTPPDAFLTLCINPSYVPSFVEHLVDAT